jgi:ribulose-phosphate 3-epimerase
MPRHTQGKIAPSILSIDFGRLEEELARLEAAGADWIHVDVMDGHFVPNLTIGPQIVGAIRKRTSLPLDTHLMVGDPDRFLEAFVRAGCDFLTVHVEACAHLHRTVHAIRALGARPGVVLNPATPLTVLEHIVADVDLVLLMSVNPGFGGQAFIPAMLPKVAALRRRLDDLGLSAELEVDGGITVGNIGEVARAGATVFVSGSGIVDTPDYGLTIARMREEVREAGRLGGLDEEGNLSAPGT